MRPPTPARCIVPFARWPFSDRISIEFPLMSIAPIGIVHHQLAGGELADLDSAGQDRAT